MVASLAPRLKEKTDFPGAGTLNNWLFGDSLRILKPQANISQDEVLSKQVVVGVNYDPTLAFPDQGCSLTAGINFYPVREDKGIARNSSHVISQGNASCGPKQRGVFREGEPLARSTSFGLYEVDKLGGTRLKFRLEAFYDLSLETSGLDDTPFAAYARGALDNVYLELKPMRGVPLAPSSIAAFGIESSADYRGFAFDYDGAGRLDHLVFYGPGTGRILIFRNDGGGTFSHVYRAFYEGIGGYDLKSTADCAFAFDYDGSGKLDHLVLYRPGTGAKSIVRNNRGTFEPVYKPVQAGVGIGGFDLKNPADCAFAFDYDGSGKLDHLVLYRPGTGAIFILTNKGGTFEPVYKPVQAGVGIGGFDLKNPADCAFAFDYDGSGKLDHLVLYRPGTGAIFILTNKGGTFQQVYAQGDPGGGIGGYDLKSTADRAFAFDYSGCGVLDHLVLYRPGTGTIFILKKRAGAYSRVYPQ